ncbi:hypothetical protein OE88DRAFT_1669464 [Heliocybe sulcata]|uniref:Fungal-type protein kinase domain-containing protein n=1 Tax=Heliocybe sulcata TaxID=5364 RepID=A0A5C3MMP9_9AGAM|nr:hypothetical protein OE88DRAFT_1669464 [Heliocybe sulcata]
MPRRTFVCPSTRLLLSAFMCVEAEHHRLATQDSTSCNNNKSEKSLVNHCGNYTVLFTDTYPAILLDTKVYLQRQALWGTYAFMAVATADPEMDYQGWHDLESFFWILFHRALHSDSLIQHSGERLAGIDICPIIYDTSRGRASILARKAYLWSVLRTFKIFYYPETTTCVSRLAWLVYNRYSDDGGPRFSRRPADLDQLTHAAVVCILQEALDLLGDPPSYGRRKPRYR